MFRLPYVDLFGGVIGMSRTHFQLVNGFSNMFWGWGGEDDDMASRVKAHDLNITRYHPEVARYHMLTHAQQKANPKRYYQLIIFKSTSIIIIIIVVVIVVVVIGKSKFMIFNQYLYYMDI